jgi:hypothetical protein
MIESTLAPTLRKPGSGAELTTSAALVTIRFLPQAITMRPAEQTALRDSIKDSRVRDASAIQVLALATLGVEGFTEERRYAYFRMMAVRNELLAAGIPASQIKLQLIDSVDRNDLNVVRLSVLK